ncbi:sulfur oxidation c-type cytochrome SoxX [Roseicella aquatilis]|uniref:Sulfur oxidation c-type cytochrome SoxX n=1 Tax=Roseicella aquatilis TaxID=2527868 RepID=A0A4V2WJF0_9PROT|nr:sulfur oxidation c-type cytochrome SoxX [Roseicella aquatilis]TCZ52759.1 sulfur oxidation c-type cytochrome SoxX [Roseicella aquatilis]
MTAPRAATRRALLAAALLLGGWAAGAHGQDVAAGRALAFDRAKGNCLACHSMAGGDVPSNVGPELAGMRARFPDREVLRAIIGDEEARNPQTVMPAFGRNLILDDREIEAVIDFLYTL